MAEREKLTCQNPNHPFKQKWYWYTETSEDSQAAHLKSREYCVSCASHMNMLKMLLSAIMMPQPTLYGNAMIKASKTQIKRLVDEL